MPAGPGQSPYPLPHQGSSAFDPPQRRRGPDLPLPHCSSIWHAPTMRPHSPREAQVSLRTQEIQTFRPFWSTLWQRERGGGGEKSISDPEEENSVYKREGRRGLGQCPQWMQSWFLCALLRLTSLGQIKPGGLSVRVRWTVNGLLADTESFKIVNVISSIL